MSKKRIVVIGASAAGLRAASRARRLLPAADIVVLDARKEISVGACGLPYFLGGEIDSPDALRETPWGAIRDEEFFQLVKGVEVRSGQEVIAIDRENARVCYRDVVTGEAREIVWDELVIATGARPRGLPGIDRNHPRLSFFTTIDEAKRWRSSLQTGQVSSVAIIGSGPLGIELAEAFTSLWGCEVQLIESLGHAMGVLLDPEVSAVLEAHLEEQEIPLLKGRRCTSIAEREDGLVIETSDGSIEAEQAICAIGFEPMICLARDAGLTIGHAGGIAVDEELRTSDPRIFAAGDCIEVKHRVSDKHVLMPLGSLANRQGRVVGDNLAGRASSFGPVVGSWAVKAFELNLAGAGLTQGQARRLGHAHAAVFGTFSDRAHYHPDDAVIHFKLVFDPDSRKLLGLQGVGRGDVVKRVDVFSNLLHRGGTIEDLLDLEFCYAPPYAPPVDPLFSLGCAAVNGLRDGIRSVPPDSELQGPRVLDVRTPGEAEVDPVVEGAVRIPLRELRERLDEVPRRKDLVVLCARGPRSHEATRLLLQNGFEGVRYLGGGAGMRAGQS